MTRKRVTFVFAFVGVLIVVMELFALAAIAQQRSVADVTEQTTDTRTIQEKVDDVRRHF